MIMMMACEITVIEKAMMAKGIKITFLSVVFFASGFQSGFGFGLLA